MYPTSTTFKSYLTRSHKIATLVEVYSGGAMVNNSLQVVQGQIGVQNEAIRRNARLTLVDPTATLVPGTATDLLAPYGNELRIYRGITFDDGTTELVPLGVFGLSEVEVSDTGESLTIRLATYDRARKVQRARLTSVYVIASGTNYSTAIKDLINSRYPGLTYNFMPTVDTTPRLVFETGADAWEEARKMAHSIGAEVFFDATGVCVLRTVPNPTTDPRTWTYSEGANATILQVEKKLTDEGVYNHVVVTGEPEGLPPVRAEKMDTDPSSPTYVYGSFGDVPYFFSSPYITTSAQALRVAESIYNNIKGSTEQINLSAIVNPAHDVGDVVRVERVRSKVQADYTISSVSIPLSAQQAMPFTVRRSVL